MHHNVTNVRSVRRRSDRGTASDEFIGELEKSDKAKTKVSHFVSSSMFKLCIMM